MHPREHVVTAGDARRLIAAQMPDLAGLSLTRVGQSGTDNVLYRVGPDLVARFPRLPHAALQIDHLARWLPPLQPGLPLAVPLASRFGVAALGYPYAWSVGAWVPGQDAFTAPPNQDHSAQTLAAFVGALQRHAVPPDAPLRGYADRLDLRLGGAEQMIRQFHRDEGDPARLLSCLADARALPPWTGQPQAVWVHGDLHPLNLLTTRGRLTAAIDWGAMAVGDPAMDLIPAWTMLDPPARARFHTALSPDPATWARARARAFSLAIPAIPYYRTTNPLFYRVTIQTLARVLEDWPP